jgi:hypothetical protein
MAAAETPPMKPRLFVFNASSFVFLFSGMSVAPIAGLGKPLGVRCRKSKGRQGKPGGLGLLDELKAV